MTAFETTSCSGTGGGGRESCAERDYRPESRTPKPEMPTTSMPAFDAALQDDSVKVSFSQETVSQFFRLAYLQPGSKKTAGCIFPRSEIGVVALPNPTPIAASQREQEIYLQITPSSVILQTDDRGSFITAMHLRRADAVLVPAHYRFHS